MNKNDKNVIINTNVTHEPKMPKDWPEGHVRVMLTGPEIDECILVWIHGHEHYLHATTARELEKVLSRRLAEFNERALAHGWPAV